MTMKKAMTLTEVAESLSPSRANDVMSILTQEAPPARIGRVFIWKETVYGQKFWSNFAEAETLGDVPAPAVFWLKNLLREYINRL
jgi:hypothetical protein